MNELKIFNIPNASISFWDFVIVRYGSLWIEVAPAFRAT